MNEARIRKAVVEAARTGHLGLRRGECLRSGAALRLGLEEAAGRRAPGRLRDAVRRGPAHDLLLDGLVSPDAGVRAQSARLCGRLQQLDAISFLEPLTADPEPRVRTAAIRALGAMRTGGAADVLLRRLRTASADRGLLVAELAHAAPDRYIEEALSAVPAPATESTLVLALGLRGGAGAVDVLLRSLDAGSAATRAAAARALGETGSGRAQACLIVSSLDRSPRVRAEALRSLRRLRSRRSMSDGPADQG